MTKSMLIEKNVQDIMFVRLCYLQGPYTDWNGENKKDHMAIRPSQKIIIKGVNSQIAFHIINIKNSNDMQDTFQRISSKVSHGVIYSVLQEILNYTRINGPKEYDQTIVEIFAKVHFIRKQVKVAMSAERDPFDIIAIVII